MGTWNFGSADNDGVLDWYPSRFDDNDELIPPTAKELNKALKEWLSGETYGEYAEGEFLGIVIKGLSQRVYPSATYLKKALSIARVLVEEKGYLDLYDPNQSKRKAALKKEMKHLQRVVGGKSIAPRAKLTTGLFESIAKSFKSKSKSNKKSKHKGDRPSPSASATLYKPGTKKKGNDGRMWKVALTKSQVHRWNPV